MKKYRNKKTEIGGFVFDSKAEASRYQELIILERSGAISKLQMQHVFTVIPKQIGERSTKYIADFVYVDSATGQPVVEDVKSKATKSLPTYVIKRKLMLERHNIKISEIIR